MLAQKQIRYDINSILEYGGTDPHNHFQPGRLLLRDALFHTGRAQTSVIALLMRTSYVIVHAAVYQNNEQGGRLESHGEG